MTDKFHVICIYKDGAAMREIENTNIGNAINRTWILTSSASARFGFLKEVKIIDDRDRLQFHWVSGKVVYPKENGK